MRVTECFLCGKYTERWSYKYDLWLHSHCEQVYRKQLKEEDGA